MIEIGGMAVRPTADARSENDLLAREAAKMLRVRRDEIASVQVLKRSVDARKKSSIKFVYRIAVEVSGNEDAVLKHASDPRLRRYEPACAPEPLRYAAAAGTPRPIVVGAGPAGLFCALELARAGAAPLLVERGHDVSRRAESVAAFNASGLLDPDTNIQFGEGGAGAFSDGKLATGIKGTLVPRVIQIFLEAGAPPEIAWDAKPHIGSDLLPDVVVRIRATIIENGGEVLFDTKLAGIEIEDGHVAAAVLEDSAAGSTHAVACSALVVACGHSARDTFSMLRDAGVAMEAKPFSVGVRIEHAQAAIDRAQYGRSAGDPALPVADYKLACHVDMPWEQSPSGVATRRGIYTFCMCPGGSVLASASEEGGVVTNGASNHARDGVNANAGLLVDVSPDDIAGADPLRGVEFQRGIERAAFELGGGAYKAPAQLLSDFMQRQASSGAGSIVSTYPRGVTWASLDECLPAFVTSALRGGIPQMARRLDGFDAPDAVLTGVETRSSSPVRILRGDGLQSNVAGLFPCGEGAGYAGGIASSAADGLRVAAAVAQAASKH